MKLPEFDDFSKSGSQVKNGQSYELSCLVLRANRVSGLVARRLGNCQDSASLPSSSDVSRRTFRLRRIMSDELMAILQNHDEKRHLPSNVLR